MQPMGNYEILSHVELPECTMRILRMRESEFVAPHYHQNSSQVYTVLEQAVEAHIGEQTFFLRPYETVRIEKGTVHSLRAADGWALVLSLSIPPLSRDDQHVVE